MKTIHFKNGETMEISIENLNILRDNSIYGNCSDMQWFSDEDDTDFCVVYSEIAFIN